MGYFVGLVLFLTVMLVVLALLSRYRIISLFPKPELDPASIASMITETVKIYGKVMIATFIILVLAFLIYEDKAKSEIALPIISAIAGYFLGYGEQGFKKKE